MSNLREDRVRTHVALLSQDVLTELDRVFQELVVDASGRLGFAKARQRVRRALGMRYLGQRYELVLAVADGALDCARIEVDFHRQHERTYGYCRHEEAVEVSSVWVSVEVDLQAISLPPAERASADPTPFASRRVIYAAVVHETPVFHRQALGAGATLTGPAVVEQLDATTVVWPQQKLRVDEYGQIVLGPIPG